MTDPDVIDFFTDQGVVDDPYPYLRALWERSPITPEPHHGVMMVTGWDEACAVAGDAETFSSCIAVTGPFPGFPVPLDGDLGGETVAGLIDKHRDELPFSDQLPTLDPPTHTNHRALLMRLITPKRLKENEDAMWELADQVLDDYLASGSGEFIGGFASPFTLLVIADLLGVPDEDRDDFVNNMHHNVGGGIGSTDAKALAHSPLEFLYAKFAEYITDRRTTPRGDVLSGMAEATFPDGSVPEPMDAARVATNVYSAGQETTVRLLGSALKTIGERPDIQQRLRRDRSLIPNFIEEVLRFESPVKGDFRLARVDAEIGGVHIPAGTTLMVLSAAANRDPRRFTDPDTFDPARTNARQHITFGRGIHSCPGSPLARAETRIAIERLLDRTSEITISQESHGPAGARRFRYIPTYILRGLIELNLEFTAVGEGAR
ncbi:cytochrome P450 [[Mycobacterium] crassicus]|uniref:Cytochrome P450 n=1 Tax=[Mycobacterium] crassicus TaxID=2872309 RepID=A0ABU5XBU4_9MYCO|nr:cytochrome P450 [Mycolicibacter sp. MYC098]MEB3019539.1 cytochrome P450 [Mycolicibacter sp. MYC098]